MDPLTIARVAGIPRVQRAIGATDDVDEVWHGGLGSVEAWRRGGLKAWRFGVLSSKFEV
jgi:hypothetical protein